MTFFTDAYTDVPMTTRGRLAEEVRRLKVQSWANPGDVDLKERVAEAEAALHAATREVVRDDAPDLPGAG